MVAQVRVLEKSRSVSLEITRFSTLSKSLPIPYGGSPFLIGGRKWGVNVYPQGLKQTAVTYGQLVDIYVHIWAKDETEDEQSFLSWVSAQNIKFTVTITEPAPASLFVTYSSAGSFEDIEDSAGWFHFTVNVPSRLLELTQDTLIVIVDFQNGSEGDTSLQQSVDGANGSNAMTKAGTMSTGGVSRLFPASHFDTAMETFFNNGLLSDFVIESEGTPIYLQKCFLKARLPRLEAVLPDELANQPNAFSEARLTLEKSDIPGCSKEAYRIRHFPNHVVHSFFYYAYVGHLPMEMTALNFGYLYVLSDAFELDHLRRYAGRGLFRTIRTSEALDLLITLGGKSSKLQEILVYYIIHNFKSIREQGLFAKILLGPPKRRKCQNYTRRLLAILRRMETGLTVGMNGRPLQLQQGESQHQDSQQSKSQSMASNVMLGGSGSTDRQPSPRHHDRSLVASAMDRKRLAAYRSLLSNPSVADVHFHVEGKVIYAQKSVLSALSDFFVAMFNRSWVESVSGDGPTIVEIPDFPYKTFYSMLLFLYTGEIDQPESMVEMGLLHVIGDKYNIMDLVCLAEGLLIRQMTPCNVSPFLFNFAYQYENLRQLCISYILREFNSIRRTQEFANAIKNAYFEMPDYASVVSELLDNFIVKDFDRVDFVPDECGDDDIGSAMEEDVTDSVVRVVVEEASSPRLADLKVTSINSGATLLDEDVEMTGNVEVRLRETGAESSFADLTENDGLGTKYRGGGDPMSKSRSVGEKHSVENISTSMFGPPSDEEWEDPLE
ncbi:Leucine-zipper-like transcriptional regulator 1 [Blyttiomyces sp. JEL0837]|nr:Leucine-zipper-like transcriptional regulator 1 [Blyttiomyces sp. JEL0837]